MENRIQRSADYGVPHPDWTNGLTEADRLVSSLTSQENRGRNRVRWNLSAVVASVTAILVSYALAKSLSEPNRGHLFARAFSETPRTKVITSGVMPSQRPGFLNYQPPADCDKWPTKSGKQGCWGQQERLSKP